MKTKLLLILLLIITFSGYCQTQSHTNLILSDNLNCDSVIYNPWIQIHSDYPIYNEDDFISALGGMLYKYINYCEQDNIYVYYLYSKDKIVKKGLDSHYDTIRQYEQSVHPYAYKMEREEIYDKPEPTLKGFAIWLKKQ